MKNFQSEDISEKDHNYETQRYIEFNIGVERYALELLTVLEVISIPTTTPVPNSPSYMVGLMNLRGKIISIVDVRKKLGIKPLEDNSEAAVIILKVKETSIGIIVDSINRVLQVGKNDVDNALEIKGQSNAQFIDGIYHKEEKMTFLLSPFKLFASDISFVEESAA